MNTFDFYSEKAMAMREIGNDEAAKTYEEMAQDWLDGWGAQLGFAVKTVQGVSLLVDDCGNEREATLTERVLWEQLISATSEFKSVEA